jgi:hypothetical protein
MITQFGFFHSFPRFCFSTPERELDVGFGVLKSILETGLLLTPEVLYFPLNDPAYSSDGKGTYIFQRRVCFTFLRSSEIEAHSSVFGAYSLELEVNSLREAGAFPVLYFPQPTGSASSRGLDEFATNLVHQIRDAVTLLKETQDTFDKITKADAEGLQYLLTEELESGARIDVYTAKYILSHLVGEKGNLNDVALYLDAMTNLFYHTDSARPWCYSGGPDLAYYQQMEWRISSGLRTEGTTIDQPLSQAEYRRLAIEPFFAKNVLDKRDGQRKPRIEFTRSIKFLNGSSFVGAIKRIWVPDVCAAEVKSLLSELGLQTPVAYVPYEKLQYMRRMRGTQA